MRRTRCMICRSEVLETVVDLRDQPNGNCFPSEETKGEEVVYPLRMAVCRNCWLCQLDDYPPAEVLFSNHPYITGLNQPVVRHFRQLAPHIVDKLELPPNSLVLDIGANDGTLLKCFEDLGMRPLGVDPGELTGRLAQEQGITVCQAFWGEETGQAMARLALQPDLITATAVFYHMTDLHDFVAGLTAVMGDDSVFVTQCVYMKDVVESVQYDHFYHEHTCIHLLGPLQGLFQEHGMRMLDVEFSDIHGGSFILYVGRDSHPLPTSETVRRAIEAEREAGLFDSEAYRRFAARVEENRDDLLDLLRHAKKAGKRVLAMGAPVKGSTVLNYAGIGPDLVEAAVEVNEFKIGRLTPGTHLPILDERELDEHPDFYLVLAWNFLDHFKEKYHDYLEAGGRFIVPNPRVSVVDRLGTHDWASDLGRSIG